MPDILLVVITFDAVIWIEHSPYGVFKKWKPP